MRGGCIAIGVSGREGKGREGEGEGEVEVKGAVALESFLDIILSGHKSHLYGVHRRRYSMVCCGYTTRYLVIRLKPRHLAVSKHNAH